MKTLALKPILSNKEADALAGEFIDDSAYSHVIAEDADVFRTDGSPLLHFRKRQISGSNASPAFHALLEAATNYGNRGIAAGKLKYHEKTGGSEVTAIAEQTDVRYKNVKRDGTVSNTNRAVTVPSGIIGAFDRAARFPYCRLTEFTARHPDRIKAAMPFIIDVDNCFRRNSPQRYANQKAACDRTHRDYIFPGTVFSTITVNKNWRTAVHQDAGDLRSGFGVLSVLSEGRYKGGLFVIPKYGVAVDIQHTDVLLVDVHEWHGNTELIPVSKYWTRLSTVHYFRSKMVGCKSLQEELELAKRRKPGQKLFHDFEGEFPE